MRKPRILSCLFVALLLSLSLMPTPSFASGRSWSKPTKSTPPPVHETKIKTITLDSITISEDKTTRTFAISTFTEVTVDGKKATVAELKPGMLVSVTLSDPTHLSRITATNKQQ